MAYIYDFPTDSFLVYESADEPKRVEFQNYLMDYPEDISDWAERISDNGTPIVKQTVPEQWIFNNPEYEYLTEISVTPTTVVQHPQRTILTQEVPITLNSELQKTALNLMNELINRGIDPLHAAGIVGNLAGESGKSFKTHAYNRNDVGAPAGGLAGWRGTNLDNLKEFAKSRNKSWKDLDTLLDFLVSTIPSDVSSKLAKATSPFEASEAWAYYEKYAGYDGSIKTARRFQKLYGWSDKKMQNWIDQNHKKRGEIATEIYNLWRSTQ